MNIGNSQLFKSFARPILQDLVNGDSSGDNDQSSAVAKPMHESRLANGVVDTFIPKAKLDVSLMRISNATMESFTLTIEGRVTGTGPVVGTISPFKLCLLYEWFCFGQVTVPELKVRPWGGKVQIQDQTIEIGDMIWFKSFIHGVILQDSIRCRLEDGKCTLTTFGLFKHDNYPLRLPIEIKGMKGPHAKLANINRMGLEVTLTLHVFNPSPVEIDYGKGRFELTKDRDLLAELTGDFRIVRGEFEVVLKGKRRPNVMHHPKAKLRGVGTTNVTSWCSKVIKLFEIEVELTPSFYEALADKGPLWESSQR